MYTYKKNEFAIQHRLWTATIVGILAVSAPAMAEIDAVALSVSPASPQPAGTVVTLQATATTDDPSTLVYRFETRTDGGDWKLLQDFREQTSFKWTTLEDGNYEVRVLAVDVPTDVLRTDATPYGLVSRGVVAGVPVITRTQHPLVVQYSAPPCAAGSFLRVRFWAAGTVPGGTLTNFKPCRIGHGVGHYLAGLRAQTVYLMRHEIWNGQGITPGPILAVPSGSPQGYVQNINVVTPAGPETSIEEPVHLLGYIRPQSDGNYTRAVDLDGNMVWSWGQNTTDVSRGLLVRPVEGGTFMIIVTEQDGIQSQILREIDLAGNIVRETNIDQVNRQLEDLGETQYVGSFHHEARRLANGHTVVLASTEKILTDTQGKGDVNVYGEAVIDFDENLQVVWYWDAFQHIDNADMAVGGEVCQSSSPGCPPLFLGPEANDWLHMNAIAYSATDGHLILSARHQDAVYKINYADGTGNGEVVWELGEHGNFSINAPGVVWPWFSHAHDPNYQGEFLVIYDNGNTRWDALGTNENSRGQVYILDESNLVATLVHNFDLGAYSAAVGSSERLANGNFMFLNGFLGTGPAPAFGALEVTPAGTSSWVMAGSERVYRSFRMRSLYQP